MKNKAGAVLICAVIIIAYIIISTNSLLSFGADESAPTMYINDEAWYNEFQYKWINIFLVDYIPISMLEKIEGIEIKVNKYLRNVMISYGENKYMTFDIDTSTVYTAKGEVYSVSTYLLYGERYIPAKLVCNYLGLRFEMTKNETAIRISDGSEKKSFNELLIIYNPSLAEVETTKKETTVVTTEFITDTGETTVPLETQEEIDARTIYFTFSGCPNEYTPDILNILYNYGYKALFLTDESRIIENAAVIRRIAVEGHTIGIMLPADKNNEVIFDYEKTPANDLLYYIIKYKTRIVSAEGYINDDKRLSLESAGYIITEYNSQLPEDNNISSKFLFDKAEEYIRVNETVIFRFYSNANTVIALPKILDYIAGMPQFIVKSLNETT
ncbi:MAG: polysaccharide deacetylase family protein [Eubacteriales bacterium]